MRASQCQRVVFWVVVAIATLSRVGDIRAQGRIVAVSHFAGQTLLAVADNGDWYSQDFGTSQWSLRSNVFTDSGVAVHVPIVASENQDWNGNNPAILDENGGVYEMNTSTSVWSFSGNIPDLSGHAASGKFVDLAVFDGPTLVALTEGGDWYAKPSTTQPWEYRSNVFATAGVVTTQQETVGALKAGY
jgi:hypothetical protein